MNTKTQLPFLTLLLMISFASVNAVLFTPALPAIAAFFAIAANTAQQTMTWFLVGYALGQLVYGPIANRFGRKPALYMGISLQIISSLICIAAAKTHLYFLLVLGRFFLALGSGVGLKMAFTLVSETHDALSASRKISYLMIAFAITPGLAVTIGGWLSEHFNWISTFYAGAIYGFLLLILVTKIPETKTELELDAFQLRHLINGYLSQFKNFRLVTSALLIGCATCFVYVFAALAPFIVINLLHMSPSAYGTANLLPPIGIISGSFLSAQLTKKYQQTTIILVGILSALLGSVAMVFLISMKVSAIFTVFIPMMFCYLSLSLIFSNASSIAMSATQDKSHGSAVMNFINMGLATLVVLGIGLFRVNIFLLPITYLIIILFMIILLRIIHFHKS